MTAEEDEVAGTLAGIADLYSKNLDAHGLRPQSVGWRDEATQRLRFEKLAHVITPTAAGQEFTVNDLGSGYGAMFSYLDALPGARLTRYSGYDISREMLAAAREIIADPRAEFIESARLTRTADYSFVSGTFNVRLDAGDEQWATYIKATLTDLAAHSTKGFAFNLLSSYVDWKKDDLFYADPFVFFDYCKRHISRYVSLLHDYPLYEWTMIVRLEAP